MKRFFAVLIPAFLLTQFVHAQASEEAKGRTIPAVEIKDMDGKNINTSGFQNDGKPMIVDFWATWCKPCVNELNAINENYKEWQEKTGVKLIAISVDDARSMARVKPFVNGQGWDYEVYIDANGDFKRAMNVNMVPHTFILNGKGEVVGQHNSYSTGDEEKLFEELQQLVKK